MDFYITTDAMETTTQMTDQCDKARERLEVCVLGSYPGLKMQKQDAHLFYCVAICFH